MNRPLVSVVVAACNREEYVAQAVQSVLDQDHAPLDVIVVDDGSTDATARVLEKFAADIRYVYQDNQGVAAARNTGVRLSKGEFLAFLDDDDLWLENKLSTQLDRFAKHPEIEAVYGHAEQFISPEVEPSYARKLAPHVKTLPAPLPGTLLIRAAAFHRVGPFDERLSMGIEVDWYARMTDAGLKTVMLPDVMLKRRLHHNNFNLRHFDRQKERLHVLKAVLDRRRHQSQPDASKRTEQ